MQENYFQKGLYICRKSMVVKIHLKTLGTIRNKRAGSDTFKRAPNVFS